MKLVQQKYRDEKKLIVSDALISRGFDFESSQDFLTNADNEKYNEYLEVAEKEDLSFREWLEKYNINYRYMPDSYISVEEMKDLISNYKYFYNDNGCEFEDSAELLGYEEVNYLEWCNGAFEWEKVEIIDETIDLELIASNVDDNKALYGQYDVYKDKDDNLYLHFQSYYTGNLGEVEEVTEDELAERFTYFEKREPDMHDIWNKEY